MRDVFGMLRGHVANAIYVRVTLKKYINKIKMCNRILCVHFVVFFFISLLVSVAFFSLVVWLGQSILPEQT